MEVVANKIPELRFPNFQGDWKNKQLKEVGQIVNGLTYSPENIRENGVLVLRSSNIQKGSLSFDDNVYVDVDEFNPVEKNDILICVRNGSRRLIGKNALITEDISGVAFGAFMTVFRSKINEFIFQLFSTSNYYKTIHQNLGATINSINNGDLKKFRFSFPSQEEQQKIASFLSTVDKKIDQLQKKKQLLEQYKKGMMQKIFKQEIRFKDENGKDFPEWKEKKLGDIATIQMGQSPDSKSYNSEGRGIPLIQGNADIKERKSEPRIFTTQSTKICEINDILLTVRAPVGSVAISHHKACIGRGVCSLKNNSQSLQGFIYQFLLNYEPKWIRLSQGSTFSAVSGKDIKTLHIRVPFIEEQKKIANFLSAIDAKIDLVATEIEKASQFKKGLLQQMFV